MYDLSPAQEILLRSLEVKSRELSFEQLRFAFLSVLEEKMRQKELFLAILKDQGLVTRMDEDLMLQEPEDWEGFSEIFGYEPSEEEAEDYLNTMYESATLELDMAEIVLGSEG